MNGDSLPYSDSLSPVNTNLPQIPAATDKKNAGSESNSKAHSYPISDEHESDDISVSVHSSVSAKNSYLSSKSLEFKRMKQADKIKTAKLAEQENVILRKEVEVLKSEVETLRRLLRDANTTLSLWIHSHQQQHQQQQQQRQQQQQQMIVPPPLQHYDHSSIYLNDPSLSHLPGGPQMDLNTTYFQRFSSS